MDPAGDPRARSRSALIRRPPPSGRARLARLLRPPRTLRPTRAGWIFFAFTLGVLGGVPTVFLLITNGAMLGAFSAMHHDVGVYAEWWAWILPHGITEIGAIFLCGGAGLMLGMGEAAAEIHEVLNDLRLSGVTILTLGQYLPPSAKHWPVGRYLRPEEFDQWAETARVQYGFAHVVSAPLARSSYLADTLEDDTQQRVGE